MLMSYVSPTSYCYAKIECEIDIQMLEEEYPGHYALTPYSFSPSIGVKLVNNPSIDFGQGLLECVTKVFNELQKEGVIKDMPVPSRYSE